MTCQSGLESLVRRECEKVGLTDMKGQDRLVSGTGDIVKLYQLLIGSRFANRVYIDILTASVLDFDTLHDLLEEITWSDYVTGKERIIIEAASTRSQLANTPTIQAVAQKAIFSTIPTPNYTSDIEVHILILIVDNVAHIMLDVTGDPLHKRGYRTESGEAPIKENLAAALIAFANWKYRDPLVDPFCGSGTIAIEAAMMARSIPPGLARHFRIESLPIHDREIWVNEKKEAETRIYPSGNYQIYASDIDPEIVEIAKRNAERAGVKSDITFSLADVHELSSSLIDLTSPTIISNPPYGKRLQSNDLNTLYDILDTSIEKYNGGYITNLDRSPGKEWKNKKLLNGSEECRFWYKK